MSRRDLKQWRNNGLSIRRRAKCRMGKSQNNDNKGIIKRKSICYASEAKVKSYLFGKATPKLKSKGFEKC